MELLPVMLWFAVGLILVVKGADAFVDASVWVSDVSGISKGIIGCTLVSFATTAPEFFVSVSGVIKGHYDLAVGNAVGSLICNIGLGFALLCIAAPGAVGDALFGKKGLIMIGATALLTLFCTEGYINIWESLALMAMFVFFTLVNLKGEGRTDAPPAAKRPTDRKEITANVLKFVLGAAALVLGSNLMVDNGQIIAIRLGVPEAVIGLTLVAIGTSLPELITSLTAVLKRESSLSLGNIVGANVLDATLILSTSAFVSGGSLAVSRSTMSLDLPVALILMLLAVLPVLFKGRTFRLQGIAIAGVYAAYLAVIL